MKTGSANGIGQIIRDIGSKMGLMDSYYETCMDKATLAFMQEVYADEASVSNFSVVKNGAKHFKWIKNLSDVSVGTIDVIGSNMKYLTKSQVEDITKTLKSNYGKVLDPLTNVSDLAKYYATACVIVDVQIGMIDTLLERADTSSELYTGLTRLKNDILSGIIGYTVTTFIDNKLLSEISKKVMKYGWSKLDIGTGSVVIGQLIIKGAMWVMFDIIWPHPDADTVISNMILSTYTNEFAVLVSNYRKVFDEPFYTSDMEKYETAFNCYLACIRATMKNTEELAETTGGKQALENALLSFKNILPNFDTYVFNCTRNVSETSVNDRITRTIAGESINVNKDGDVIVGTAPDDVTCVDSLPLTSENSTLWNVNIYGGYTLLTGSNVTIPELTGSGTVKLYDTLNIEYNMNYWGEVYLNHNTLIVGWNYTNGGYLHMENDDDYVLVNGNYEQSTRYYDVDFSEYITAGTLEIKGDMVSCFGYKPTGTHKTVLSGEGEQQIFLYNNGYYGQFSILEIANTSDEGVTFNNDIYVLSKILQPIGTALKNKDNVKLQNKTAFVDYGESNAAINLYNGNAENVMPTWLDYENCLSRNTKITSISVGSVKVNEENEAIIPVSIKNNSGIADFRYVIDYNSDDIEILEITPSENLNANDFRTNLGHETENGNTDGLIVTWYQNDDITADCELFNIKVNLKNTDLNVSPISIKAADNNICDSQTQTVIADYETGYVMTDNYIVENVKPDDFSCELYFDNTFNEQTARAFVAFYDEHNRLVQFDSKEITVKPGKVDFNVDVDNKPYSTYKIMVWEGLTSLRPLVEVK